MKPKQELKLARYVRYQRNEVKKRRKANAAAARAKAKSRRALKEGEIL